MTGYSDAQRRAALKYRHSKIDSIHFSTPKGDKDRIKQAAADAGQSLSQYILQAVYERMERERSGSTGSTGGSGHADQ